MCDGELPENQQNPTCTHVTSGPIGRGMAQASPYHLLLASLLRLQWALVMARGAAAALPTG
jgi:hypothetical protein